MVSELVPDESLEDGVVLLPELVVVSVELPLVPLLLMPDEPDVELSCEDG